MSVTTKRAVIENPYCEVKMGRLCAGFTIGGDRYHVWLNEAGTEVKDDRTHTASGATPKQILYRRPVKHLMRGDPGYYDCKHLDATAKVNAALIAELLASIDPAQAWAEYRAKQAEEESKLKAEAKAREHRKRLDEAAPDLLQAAEGLIDWLEQVFPDEPLFHGDEKTEQAFRMKDLRAAIRKAKGPS